MLNKNTPEVWEYKQVLAEMQPTDRAICDDLYREASLSFSQWVGGLNRGGQHTFIDSEKISGFALRLRSSEVPDDLAQKYLAYWIDLLLQVGYRVNITQLQSTPKGIVHKAYLKPSLKYRSAPKADQLYGNIELNLEAPTSTSVLIRMQCMKYQDQHFLEARPFRGLFQVLDVLI